MEEKIGTNYPSIYYSLDFWDFCRFNILYFVTCNLYTLYKIIRRGFSKRKWYFFSKPNLRSFFSTSWWKEFFFERGFSSKKSSFLAGCCWFFNQQCRDSSLCGIISKCQKEISQALFYRKRRDLYKSVNLFSNHGWSIYIPMPSTFISSTYELLG